jgi:hypothetical protein
MKIITRSRAAILLLLLSLALGSTTTAQQRRQTPTKTPAKPAATPAPTFDTLLPAESYTVYGEIRGAGQLIRSNALNDLLEPILKLAGPQKEFKSIVKWLNAHAEEVMTSRLLVATWPLNKLLPETIIAIEFASAEEAAKFATPLNEFWPTVLPTPVPDPSPAGSDNPTPEKPKPTEPAKPNFNLLRVGSLVLITPRPLALKQLRPAGSKLLAEDVNFRAARNRFNSEPVFVFIDIKSVERQEAEQRKHNDAEGQKEAAQVKRAAEEGSKKEQQSAEPEPTDEEKATAEAEEMAKLMASSREPAKEAPTPDPVWSAFTKAASGFGDAESDWPEAIALALSIEGDSFDLRALLVNSPGEKGDAVPFMPMLIPGPAYSPEAPNIFPADTELFATMSLDLPQIYSVMSRPRPNSEVIHSRGSVVNVSEVEFESPFAALEKQLKISFKDDLLPLLGSEVALRLPVNNMNVVGLGLAGAAVSQPELKESTTAQEQATAPVLAIALKDKDGMRTLLPRLVDNLGFKGAGSLAQTEKREDTEIVSFANLFSYALIGNFLVLSSDPATTRHIVDSYLKHETLSGNIEFKSSTRWQPRQVHGQLYISPVLMESYKNWTAQPSTKLTDQMRAFLTRVSMMAQPITYSLANEGLGPIHELHLPKNLVLMAVAGVSGELNPPPTVQNERLAIGLLYTIAQAEQQYKEKKGGGNCGTLEQLIAADLVSKEMIENSRYRFDVTISGDKFEVSAVPLEYGKNGSMSFFIDHTGVVRGGDHSGASATSSDPPIN